jgi:hypothetical protein
MIGCGRITLRSARGVHPLTIVAVLGMNALIRLWTRLNLGIEPDPNYLLMHWQHLPLESLNSDFFQSIWSLHSQPPLWNVIVGLYSKLCEADTSCVVHSIFVQHLLFTTLICYCLYKVLALVTRSPTVALISAAMFSLLPSTFYYENYTYYSHATLLLSSWLMYGSAKWLIQKEKIGIAYSAISLSLLALTWTLFHPLFVGILLTFITATAWQTARRTAILAVAAAIIVASLPSFKNQLLYGVFAMVVGLGSTLPRLRLTCRAIAVSRGLRNVRLLI